MREILFKAKRKDVGLWQEGQIIQIGDRYFISDEDYTKIEKSIMDISGEIIYDLKFMYEVFPETICEYIGLTDKNGVKIFENDYCRLYENEEFNICIDGVVEFYRDRYILRTNKKAYTDFMFIHEKNIEVIKNIFDEEVK